MTATATTPDYGKRYAMARYDDDRRALVCQRIDEDTVQLTDIPLAGGRPYLVEAFDLTTQAPADALAEMKDLVAAYIDHAQELGRCPMAEAWWTSTPDS